MATTLVSLNALLKEDWFNNKIIIEFNDNVESWTDFDKAVVTWTGKFGVIALNTSRNDSVDAWDAPGSATPQAGQQGYDQLHVTARKIYGAIQIDGLTLAQAQTPGTVGPQFKTDMQALIRDFKKRLATFIFVGGQHVGYMWGRVAALGVGADIGYRGRFVDIAVNADLAGSAIELYRSDTYAIVGVATQINAIDDSTLTLNAPGIDTTATPLGTVFVVKVVGAQAALLSPIKPAAKKLAAVAVEPQGFIGNLSSQILFGLDRSAATPGAAALRSNFLAVDGAAAQGGALGTSDLGRIFAKVMTRSSYRYDCYWLSWMQLTAYEDILLGATLATPLVNNIRVDPTKSAGKVDPGSTQFAYAGVPFKASDSCPNGLIFATQYESYKRAEVGNMHWLGTESGLDPIQKIQGADALAATFGHYYDLVCQQPNANAVITALAKL